MHGKFKLASHLGNFVDNQEKRKNYYSKYVKANFPNSIVTGQLTSTNFHL